MNPKEMFRQQAVDKLNSPDNLNELLTVTTPKSWLLLATIGLLLGAAVVWGIFATIETTVTGNGILISPDGSDNALEAVLYVTMSDGERIAPGMVARISPNTVRLEEYGMVFGRVTSVEQSPSTQSEMLEVLGNDSLVQALAVSGEIVEVRLLLIPDTNTPSGYAWTSAGGPPSRLWGGSLSDGFIVVSQQRPIDLVMAR
jgi:HlyD family secretion protein